MSFWDSSALVPLCINEDRSQSARRLWRLFREHSVWRESVVEVESTFARLERDGSLAPDINRFALKNLATLESNWVTVEPSARMIEIARALPATYGLRTLDSLQLASALVWCKEFPKNQAFISGDLKLLRVAEVVGFDVHRV